jgi:vacuolar-type H+-ATPase subunit I/STV1
MNNAILLENLKKERHNREESIRLASAAADEAIKALASVKRMRELKPDDPNAAEAARKATELANLVSQELTRVSESQKTLKKERSALLRESEKISELQKQRAKSKASSENGLQKKKKKNGNNKEAGENAVMPVNYCVGVDKENATLWIVVEGSTNFASWQTNLTWTPTTFEDKINWSFNRWISGVFARSDAHSEKWSSSIRAR